MKIDTKKVAEELSLDYEMFCEEGTEPELSSTYFYDIMPELMYGGPRSKKLAKNRLFRHQEEAISALMAGKNIILISGTGSGKTEAWAIYALAKRKKTLVIYPTLALTADQINRLYDYASSLGQEGAVVRVDSPTVRKIGKVSMSAKIRKALIIITNPAFLMNDIKRYAEQGESLLSHYFKNLDLIIADELDFYGSHGASLLMTLIDIISSMKSGRNKPQVSILTATLGNPENVAEILTEVIGRETLVIKGKPFKLSNCTFVVYGKNIEKFREKLIENLRALLGSVPERYAKIVGDPILFRRNFHSLIEALISEGIPVRLPYFDPTELFIQYVNDDVVTVVFTPSIKVAEKLYRRTIEKLPQSMKDVIAVHHHLVTKEKRKAIEDSMRQDPPRVKVVFTVKTLLQGIDIPTIGRVIHYGLPVELRELLQREGRKGRSRSLGRTESIIIPITRWDREIASKGKEGVKEFISLPLEYVYMLPGNEYSLLFKSMFEMLVSGSTSAEGLELLSKFGLVKENHGILMLSSRGWDVWRKLNFYEYGPPYGIPRYLKRNNETVVLEPVGRRDFVEKYQPGMIDYSTDALVVESSYRGVVENYLSELDKIIGTYDWFKEAIGKYEEIKTVWKEIPRLQADIVRGKINSRVDIFAVIPEKGFGRLMEIPIGVEWEVESHRRMKAIFAGNSLITLYEKERIYLDSPVEGVYTDFTYGFSWVSDPSVEIPMIKLALSSLRLMLRLSNKYAISVREISALVKEIPGGSAIVLLWEPQASAILKHINWGVVISAIEELSEVSIWRSLLGLIDEESKEYVLQRNMTWEGLKELAINFIKTVVVKDEILLEITSPNYREFMQKEKAVSVEIVSLHGNGRRKYFLAKFDGQRAEIKEEVVEGLPTQVKNWLIRQLEEALDKGITLVIPSNRIMNMLYGRTAKVLYNELKKENLIINPYEVLRDISKSSFIDIRKIAKSFNLKLVSHPEKLLKISKAIDEGLIREFVNELVKLHYYMYIIAKHLSTMKKD